QLARAERVGRVAHPNTHRQAPEGADGAGNSPTPIGQPDRTLALIASIAALALEPSGPPACAKSGRPPPPLPPSASAPILTSSTALLAGVQSPVTPTARFALPSTVAPAVAPTPEPTCLFPSSSSPTRS